MKFNTNQASISCLVSASAQAQNTDETLLPVFNRILTEEIKFATENTELDQLLHSVNKRVAIRFGPRFYVWTADADTEQRACDNSQELVLILDSVNPTSFTLQ